MVRHHQEEEEEDITGFEDEPLDEVTGGPTFHFEGVDTALAKAERRRYRRMRRYERAGKIIVAVFCVCLIIALILVFEVFKVTEKAVHDSFTLVTDSPTSKPTQPPTILRTPAPTPMPKPTLAVATPNPTQKKTPSPTVAPTVSPTITPQPSFALQSTYEMKVVEDTYLFLDGQNTARSYGKAETLLVQHGTKLSTKPGQMPTIPTSYTILKFDLKRIENFPDRSRWTENMQAKLFLTHVPKDEEDADALGDTTMDVYRIPNNYDLAVESWTGTSFTSAPKVTREGIPVGRKTFGPMALTVAVDITSAFRLPEEDMASGLFNDDQILLMLLINDGNPSEGEEFRSRESNIPIAPRMQFVMD